MAKKQSYLNRNVYNKLDSADKSAYLQSAANAVNASGVNSKAAIKNMVDAHNYFGAAKKYSKKKIAFQKAMQKAQTLQSVGQGYKGLGKNELQSRINQAKYLHKKADKQATYYDNLYGQVVKSGYVDIFGDAKWAAKKYKSYKKVADQFDKQYSNLVNKNKKLEY